MRYYNDESVWNDFMATCDCLPLCAIINDKIFAVHAGISPSLHNIDEINSLNRFQEIPLISFLLYQFFFPLFFTKVFSVTYCGPILRRLKGGILLREALVRHMGRTFQSSFCWIIS